MKPDAIALIRSLKEAREEAARWKKNEEKLRELLLPLVEEAGGSIHDEVSGLTARLKRMPRYEYDATALYKLVSDGAMYETEYAECLKTIVDKAVVDDWLKRGIITDRQLNAVDAKTVTSVSERLEIA